MKVPKHYPTPSVLLHWLTALLILAALPLGLYLSDLPLSPNKLKLISYHKWIGITVLFLFLPRLVLRLTRPVPPPLDVPAWQRFAAAATHGLLYVLIIAVPLTGWLMSSAKGFPVVYLGILPLPDLLAKDPALGDLFKTIHEMLNNGLLVLIGLHVAAALKHQFIDRDDTLVRMMPILKRST
ncbi:cytochrome b [Azoarcus sp. KH32C]|uniref:cytochrome b n=1 Tax=Azoarcus sp. KH32C TaxID=748247 RepID=UPI0002386FD8|nr:cytochrome b [Azoarcus sp. KH32C]BAL23947.1 cytochrome b561 [Azoarcus sp. KH32C]